MVIKLCQTTFFQWLKDNLSVLVNRICICFIYLNFLFFTFFFLQIQKFKKILMLNCNLILMRSIKTQTLTVSGAKLCILQSSTSCVRSIVFPLTMKRTNNWGKKNLQVVFSEFHKIRVIFHFLLQVERILI